MTIIHAKIRSDLLDSMRRRSPVEMVALRAVLAACANELIAKNSAGTELPDADAVAVISRLARQRKDSIAQFTAAGRADLVQTEEAELQILERYLPRMMTREEIECVVRIKKDENAITDKKEAGRLVGIVMKELRGKADGAVVKEIVERVVA